MTDINTSNNRDNDNSEKTGNKPPGSSKGWDYTKHLAKITGPHRPERVEHLEATIQANKKKILQWLASQSEITESTQFAMIRDDEAHLHSRPDTPIGGEPAKGKSESYSPTHGPRYQRLTDIREWAENIDQMVDDARRRTLQDYSRMPPLLDAKARKARKESEPIRIEGEQKLDREAKYSQDVLIILEKHQPEGAVNHCGDMLSIPKSGTVSDYDHTLVNLQDGRPFEFTEAHIRNVKKHVDEAHIPFVPITGRDWRAVEQAFKNAGPDGKYLLTKLYIYTEYGDLVWCGPEGKSMLRDSRLERYREPTRQIQDAIEKQIKQDAVLNKYTDIVGMVQDGVPRFVKQDELKDHPDIARGGRLLVGVTRKTLSGTLLGGNSRDLIRIYLKSEKKLNDEEIESEMTLINKSSREIMKGVLEKYPQFELGKTDFTGYDFGLNQARVKEELQLEGVDVTGLEIANKAAAVDDIIHRLGLTGGILVLGDDITDTDMAKRLRLRKEEGKLKDYAFGGVKRAEGKVQENVKYRATFFLNRPEETVDFIGAVVDRVIELKD